METPVRSEALVVIPSDYDDSVPTPLLLLLHGLTDTAENIDDHFAYGAEAEAYGFIMIAPQGSQDSNGFQFWNATDECCNLSGKKVDDVAYLSSVIEEAKSNYTIDASRIYIVGHSNGGFMAYRMVCELQNTFAAVVSYAGASFSDPSQCAYPDAIHALHIHGDQDELVSYVGDGPFPGAEETIVRWANRAGCDGNTFDEGPKLDLDANTPGDETFTRLYNHNCSTTSDIQLWTITNGVHNITPSPSFTKSIFNWLNPKKIK
ncbi:MAG: prolyl oligopeptidase family serine peptidase [Myxococcales bacterium]|nr:MAG: prolyl oligopeptidase family serine peptidase [Myxococcales bacterium]